MKLLLLALAVALPAAGACTAQQQSPQPRAAGVETCVDSITGSPAMSAAIMRQTEQRYWPELPAREEYRLSMLHERLGAYLREGHAFPTHVNEFTAPIAEVPWLSTCDPWGHRVRLSAGDREFELRSAGPDGVFSTADDLVATGLMPRPAPSAPPGD